MGGGQTLWTASLVTGTQPLVLEDLGVGPGAPTSMLCALCDIT